MITPEQEYEIFVQYELLKDLSYEDGIPNTVRIKMNSIAENIQRIIGYRIG